MANVDVSPGGGAPSLSNERGRAAVEFQALIETLPAAIYITTLEEESRTLYMSPQAERMFGLPTSDVHPLRVREMLHPDDRERAVSELARGPANTGPVTLEYRIVRPDGSVVWLEDTSVVLPGAPGEPQRVQGYLLDISDRKRLEEALLQSQKMDAVGQLAGGIAHDFNNILTAIQGYTEFALARPAANEELRDDLIEIRKAAARAATLTRQILAFGRRQVFHSVPVDLNDVIDDTKKLILRVIGEHIQVASHLEVPLGTVLVDPSQITQVLVNLAVNARDAMPEGGRLTIETGNVDVDGLTAQSTGLEPGRYVVLRVTDTGIGMDPETARRAFEPFFTTKPVGSGTGLGLSMVYGIAQQSGGRASVYSEPGLGTVVRVYLPRIEDQPVAPVASEPTVDASPRTGTILLVEDEDVIRALTTTMLERHGYDVLATGDPREAIELGAESGDIDLLLTDLVMPGMNGKELARRLVAERPLLRVLYTSGYPAGAVAGQALLAEAAPLLQKPFSSGALLDSVRDALA
ncbi:MAG: sensor protein [Actinomycetia bacterium]|nr:sensor protein [Actinomycetes bacterium]